ncbi:MAG: HEAT repeat domain-containing protein [Fimbriimonadales bacterium]|nr:MAG: hypothetical protein KatS3mg018_0702 [Fimbriimonadales bacterium]
MDWQGVEVEVEVPCTRRHKHLVRLRFIGWGEYEVAYNPCMESPNLDSRRQAPCVRYLLEKFPQRFRDDSDLKSRLLDALQAAGSPATPALIRALEDTDHNIRERACLALGKGGDLRAVPALIQQLGDRGEYIAWAASRALAEFGAPAVPELLQALKHENKSVRAGICGVLGEIGDAHAVPALIKRLRDSSVDVRLAASRALGEIGDARAVPALIETLPDVDYWVTKEACRALVRIGISAVPALIQATQDNDLSVRVESCVALGQIGDSRAVPALVRATGDPQKWVRAAACEALGQIADSCAVPVLIQALDDSEEEVRVAACEALGKIGDPAAIPYLRRVVAKDRICASRAKKAITQIRAAQTPNSTPEV